MYFYHTNFKNVCCYGKSSDSNTSKRKGSREIYIISIQRSTKVWNNHEQKTTMCEIWTHRKSTSAINLAFKQDWNTIYQVEYMHLFKINEEAHRPYSHLSIKDHEGPVIKAHICISQPPSLSLQNKTILNKDRLHYNHFTIAFSVLCISTCQQIDRINLTPPPQVFSQSITQVNSIFTIFILIISFHLTQKYLKIKILSIIIMIHSLTIW